MHGFAMRNQLHAASQRVLRPFARRLSAWGVTPNQVSLSGFALNVVAAVLIVGDQLLPAGIVWLLAGAFDMLDGTLARTCGLSGAFGAFLDSTLDRLSEGVVLAAACYHFAAIGQPVDAGLAALALVGSLTVSYARARAESLGATCTTGLLTRSERVLLIGVGLCLGVLVLAVYLLLALTAITVLQRIWRVSHGLSTQR